MELKTGRATDVVVGQVLRYRGYVKEELAEKDQTVKGIIMGLLIELANEGRCLRLYLTTCQKAQRPETEPGFLVFKQSV